MRYNWATGNDYTDALVHDINRYKRGCADWVKWTLFAWRFPQIQQAPALAEKQLQ
ncbi:MAG: hypothetical protein Q8L79_06800 [Methylobacter sp.]|uniref:hypothetical protein n=1 Tax=Methylobacter sp. TaxID=2051955 RepID=UPI00272F9868|nr:hypothetical protein [Methylobacter sp.]MDP1664822.1 hypothetical protein [Methylobacter sp.]